PSSHSLSLHDALPISSHELRTPLTALSGELELALAQAPTHRELRPGLSRALDQVVAMRELVEALLLLSRVRNLGDAAAEFEAVKDRKSTRLNSSHEWI